MTAEQLDNWVERASTPETPSGPLVAIGWIAAVVLMCLAPAIVIAGWGWLL